MCILYIYIYIYYVHIYIYIYIYYPPPHAGLRCDRSLIFRWLFSQTYSNTCARQVEVEHVGGGLKQKQRRCTPTKRLPALSERMSTY